MLAKDEIRARWEACRRISSLDHVQASRDDIPALLDECERLEQTVAELTEELADAHADIRECHAKEMPGKPICYCRICHPEPL